MHGSTEIQPSAEDVHLWTNGDWFYRLVQRFQPSAEDVHLWTVSNMTTFYGEGFQPSVEDVHLWTHGGPMVRTSYVSALS